MIWPFRKRRTFDVAAQSDPRNEMFPVHPLLPPVNEPVAMRWHCPVRLDQGREGACVGFGLTHFLATGPAVLSRPSNADAFELYEDIKRNDRRPGESYDGTWIEDGLKLLQKRGIIDEYRWPKTADEMARCLSYVGPLVVKVPIYGSFHRPNKYGMIQPCGKIEGWHCMLADEIVPGAKQIWFLNSWGSRWGKNGRCWMSYNTANFVLSHGGTAAVATKTA
jgi:hypothetical protein